LIVREKWENMSFEIEKTIFIYTPPYFLIMKYFIIVLPVE